MLGFPTQFNSSILTYENHSPKLKKQMGKVAQRRRGTGMHGSGPKGCHEGQKAHTHTKR